jgi:hypothetical protein
MNRHRDHLAPCDLTHEQLEGLGKSDHIRHLRQRRLALKDEIRALYGTLKKAERANPDRYREHEAAVKELTRVRAVYRREKKVEFREDYFDTMPGVEIDKQIDQLLGKSSEIDEPDVVTDSWEPAVPEYAFAERARIADAFFGPEAELSAGEKALTRRIQLVHDLAALCHLREQSRRGKRFNWNNADETGDTIISNRGNDDWNKADKTANTIIPNLDDENSKIVKPSLPSPPLSPPASPRPSSDQCPFCFFDDGLSSADRMRPYSRIDSLRRHVLRIHLNQASRHDYSLRGLAQPRTDRPTEDGPIVCPVPACGGLVLQGHKHYKNHAAKVHKGPF